MIIADIFILHLPTMVAQIGVVTKIHQRLDIMVPGYGEGANRGLHSSRDHHLRHLHLYSTGEWSNKVTTLI